MAATRADHVTAGLGPDDYAELTCAACPHPLDAHDPIGTRYCSATTAGGLDRGCVCAELS